MAVTIQSIKALQERTGAGIMDCKKALIEANGDEEKAIDILREKGIAKAAAKAGRTAAEGVASIGLSADKKTAVIVEINCETDFVSGSPKFHEIVDSIVNRCLEKQPATLEEAVKATDAIFTDAVVAMRENFVLRRYLILKAEGQESFGKYIHAGGKIACLVELNKDMGEEISKGLAMTVASSAPEFLTIEDGPADTKARELAIAQKEVAEDPKLASKPDQVKATIAERKVASRLGDACLGSKAYALDMSGKLSVDQLCKEKGFQVLRFVRYEVGQLSK